MTTLPLLSPGGATADKQDSAAVILAAIRDAVLALENLSATVSGTVSVGNFPTTQQVSGSVAVTNPVTSVAVNNLPATQPVSGTVAVSNQPTPQTDALTNTQLRASAVPVSGPATDAQLRATPLPVSGTVNTGGLTDTQLRAAPVPISGFPATQAVSGTVAVSNQPTNLAVNNFPATQTVSGTVSTIDSGERDFTHVVATVTNSGDTTVITPTSGKAIRLRWFYAVNDPTAATPTLINVRLGATAVYRAWALSKRQQVTGPVNGALVINLSAAGSVAVTVLYEEV